MTSFWTENCFYPLKTWCVLRLTGNVTLTITFLFAQSKRILFYFNYFLSFHYKEFLKVRSTDKPDIWCFAVHSKRKINSISV